MLPLYFYKQGNSPFLRYTEGKVADFHNSCIIMQGKKEIFPARVIDVDKWRDLALILAI
jgi:hypothetical protein